MAKFRIKWIFDVIPHELLIMPVKRTKIGYVD